MSTSARNVTPTVKQAKAADVKKYRKFCDGYGSMRAFGRLFNARANELLARGAKPRRRR